MADNVPITAGVGTSIATDQVGADHYQRVQPAVFRRRQVSALVTPAGSSYVAGEAIGAAVEMTNFGRSPFQSGAIEQFVVALDDPIASASLKAYFFDGAPTVAGDSAEFDPSFADLDDYLGHAYLGNPSEVTATKQWWDYATNDGNSLEIPYILTGTSLWVVLVALSSFGPIAAANEWKIGVTARLD